MSNFQFNLLLHEVNKIQIPEILGYSKTFNTSESILAQLPPDDLTQLRRSIERVSNAQYVDAWSIFLLISSLIVFISSVTTHLKVISAKTKNIISYIKPKDNKEKNIIEGNLRQVMGEASAIRVAVAMFHNGSSIGSYHFNKMSMLYEVTKSGYASIKSKVQNIPFVNIEKSVQLSSADKWTKFSISTPNLDKECIKYLRVNNLEAVYSRLLASKEGIYGIIELQYSNEEDSSLSDETFQIIESSFYTIAFLLDLIRRDKPLPT